VGQLWEVGGREQTFAFEVARLLGQLAPYVQSHQWSIYLEAVSGVRQQLVVFWLSYCLHASVQRVGEAAAETGACSVEGEQ
jgi:hypothetical protein